MEGTLMGAQQTGVLRYRSQLECVKNMLRTIAVLVIATALSLPAGAQDLNPGFATAQVASTDLNIEVSWRERGLWPESIIHNVITSESSATYVCLEGGKATMADRQNVDELVSAEGDFNATTHGSASGKLTLKPPSSGMFSCPPGQQLKIACAVYTNLICRDDRYAVSLQLRGRYVLFQPGYSEFCDLDLR
jgi:hypothetical protein